MSSTAPAPMRAGERAYRVLLDDIQSNRLAAGTVLGEVEQAARLGVSRTPLREALNRLIADGLVVQVSPRVTAVSRIDAADIRRLFEARTALETMTARLAAERGDRARFRALAEEIARAGTRLGDPAGREDYYRLIAAFDAAIDEAVANEYLISALRTLRTHLVRVRRMAQDNPERLAQSVAEHRLIASAIGAGDRDLAAHATHVHLHNALTTILESLPEEHS
jgi:DNA-binding GntR family transcriptional regulator